MSAQATARVAPPAFAPRPRPEREATPSARLRVVRAPAQARTRVPFVLVCMGVLAVALLSALLLNTQMAQASYAIHDKTNELARLDQDQKDLVAVLDHKSSPEELAQAARRLDMVPAAGTGWVRLSDGSVQGAPKAKK
ncbi:hypothetical protein [Cellulomonas rhizosphaerae]|uniref:Cell division protein FtsL n=1 Tax=Cellulomonas rhizosphaerae TaxID=2293719 RepID=A0A413RMJ7_9CELL|nr:hypothetical protein [Cellulomonas rhizosphaerae]RHA42006.1 hypothetical protein D1825_07690 [Cellulomonas rhizosphaerae]